MKKYLTIKNLLIVALLAIVILFLLKPTTETTPDPDTPGDDEKNNPEETNDVQATAAAPIVTDEPESNTAADWEDWLISYESTEDYLGNTLFNTPSDEY